jgi:hypothetical protein
MDLRITITYTMNTDVITQEFTLAGDAKEYMVVSIAAGTTQPVLLSFDPDNLVAYCFLASAALTMTSVPSTGTADVINLAANVPQIWYQGMQQGDHFANTNSINSFNVQNAGTTAATLQILVERDATP